MLLLFKYRNKNPYQPPTYTALGLFVLGWILGVYFVARIKLNQMMREGSFSDVYLSTLDAIKGCDFTICDSKRKFVENTRTNYTMRSFIFSLNQQTWKSNLPGHSLMIELAETLFILGFRCSWALH